jgi:hypothetical protein
MMALAPPPVLDRPSGFPPVVAREPVAPVTSLSELPYSRTASPQVRDVLARLAMVNKLLKGLYCKLRTSRLHLFQRPLHHCQLQRQRHQRH